MVHFAAIEIGTSDFGIADVPAGSRTLYVEPVPAYIESLEDKIAKELPELEPSFENAAVYPASHLPGIAETEKMIFYLDPADIERYQLPGWARGCNMISKPHPEVVSLLEQRKLDFALIKRKPVPSLSLRDICRKWSVSSIGLLKYDTEGMDCQLVRAALDELEPHQMPRVLQFECFWQESPANIDDAVAAWAARGYRLLTRGKDVIMIKGQALKTPDDIEN